MSKETVKKYLNIRKLALIVIAAFLQAIAINVFITPANLYSGGITGLALFIQTVLLNIDIKLSFGLLYFLFNVPLLILAWKKLGKRFSFYTIFAVITLSICTNLVPDTYVVSEDQFLMSIFAGILLGAGVTLVLKAGGSTGGLDIVAMFISERTSKPMGTYALFINIGIFTLIAFNSNPEIILFSIVNTYVCSVVIDKLHTRYKKLTLTVTTTESDKIIEEYMSRSTRGITIIPAIGAYTRQPRDLLYFVISSYELTATIELIKRIDNNAFINIIKTERVFGNFTQPNLDDI